MSDIEFINNSECNKINKIGCADNVPYLMLIEDNCCNSNETVIEYLNLNTGAKSSTQPANFTLGECSTSCIKEYKDACANGVPYLVSIQDGCDSTSITLEYINLNDGSKSTVAPAGLQYTTCDTIPILPCITYQETESFVATAGQTTFSLANTPNGDVRFSRNGSTLSDSAATLSGQVVTYVAGSNNSENLLDGDRIDITYVYEQCDTFELDSFKDCIGNDIARGTSIVTCAALNPDHFDIDANTGEISSKCCDNEKVCYGTTVSVPGTPQSPATGTTLDKSATIFDATKPWGTIDSSTPIYGSPNDASTYNAPWYVYSGTPQIIRDDNGVVPGETHTRLDNGDAVSYRFQGYEGVVYDSRAIFRKIQNDGLGNASITLKVKRPDGSVVSLVTKSSGRAGGNSGWDTIGDYNGSSEGRFTATQTGTYEYIWEGSSASPSRLLVVDVKVSNASGEVVSSTTTNSLAYTKITENGVDTWYDADGNIIAAPNTNGLQVIDCPTAYVVAGNGIRVAGSGTVSDPYVISLA